MTDIEHASEAVRQHNTDPICLSMQMCCDVDCAAEVLLAEVKRLHAIEDRYVIYALNFGGSKVDVDGVRMTVGEFVDAEFRRADAASLTLPPKALIA